MQNSAIAAVLVHVPDVKAALDWYQRAFPHAVRCRLEAFDFDYRAVGKVNLEIVCADKKVTAGAAGSVVYWRIPDFESGLAHLQDVGASLYRGPMDIEEDQRMCQVRDPWGNCIGLRGPSANKVTSRETPA